MRPKIIAFLVLMSAGCDAVHQSSPTLLVVESYVASQESLPVVHLRQTRPLDDPYVLGASTAAAGATVRVAMDSLWFDYAMDEPGVYEPLVDHLVLPQAELSLDVAWQGQRAAATTRVPPVLTLDSVLVVAGEEPVSGLILDSLFIDPAQIDTIRFDSLRTGASEGFVYLVEVTMQWRVDYAEEGLDGAYWVRTQLRPDLADRTRLDEYFLRPEQLLKERHIARDAAGRRIWTGVYAVPVDAADAPMPVHRLRVALVRSTQAYAQFVSGSDNPRRREPPTNITGALGIFAGVSVDSFSVVVQ